MKTVTPGSANGATIYHVANVAGVSTATVSRALNGTAVVAEPTRRRILQAVRDLGYGPNSIARSLKTGTTKTIGLILPDITNPFFPELVKGVQLLADERTYALLLSQTGGAPDVEERYLDLLVQGRAVDGILLVGMTLRGARLARFGALGIPSVSLDRNVNLPGMALVHLDNRTGGRHATEHLLSLGHRVIAHIGGPASLTVSHEREQGYADALRSAGVRPDGKLVVEGDFTEEGGRKACLELLDAGARPTATFAANDLMAIGAMAALKERGVAVPQDLSVVGFDDIHLAAYTSPALTTVHQPTYEMGRRAAEILIDEIQQRRPVHDDRQLVFQGELIVRDSTARLSGGSAPGWR